MSLELDPPLRRYLEQRREVLAEVRRLLAASVDLARPLETIDPDTALFGTGLGLDSLDAVEILIGLEVDLGIQLQGDEERLLSLRSVNALVDLVMRQRGILP